VKAAGIRTVRGTTVADCRIVELPRIHDSRGNLTFFEGDRHIPFRMKRAYWLYDIPGGEQRGGHACHRLQEFAVALSGSFDVHLHDGHAERVVNLNRSYLGLYIPAMIWRHIENFSTNAVCLLVASDSYSEDDYLRDRVIFLRSKGVVA
jgi:WxcM-like protein